MKILWIVNIVFPEALSLLTKRNDSLKATGGWMLGAANALLSHPNIELCVVSVSQLVTKLEKIDGRKISYYLIPYGKGNTHKNSEYRKYFRTIKSEYQPDVVHIHGSEYSHGLAYVEECGNEGVVLSIQGMISVYAKYHLSGIPIIDIIKNITIRDLLTWNTIINARNDCRRQGKYEVELLNKISNVIGRTSWDKSHVWAINPDINYFFCNETLRDCFYEGSWNYEDCEKYSIFCSSAQDPVKGFHQLLMAMPIVQKHFPQAKIYVSGIDVTRSKDKYGFLKRDGYGHYLKKLINKYHLGDSVVFLGALDAEGMKKQYLNANVFVCPSSIENSPNSIGEAQILGTPCVASYVGGVMDMMSGDEGNMYRFEEIEMLAYKICEVFNNGDCSKDDIRGKAQERHSPVANSKRLLFIYNYIKGHNQL